MKNVMNLKKSVAFVMLFACAVFFTAMDRMPAYDPSATCTYEIETPDGAIFGDMEVAKDGDTYTVTVQTDDFGDLELEDVEVKDGKEKDTATMTGSVDVQGVSANFDVEFSGDEMEGFIEYGGEELPIVAEKQ